MTHNTRITHYIRGQSLTLQFLEIQQNLLLKIPRHSINTFNVEEHWDVSREFQDDGGPMDNVDLEGGENQLHDATTGPQDDGTSAFDFHIDQTFSPPPEPGPSRVSRIGQVFRVAHPESDCEPEEEGEEDELQHNEDTYVYFRPDVESEEDDNDELRVTQLEDPTSPPPHAYRRVVRLEPHRRRPSAHGRSILAESVGP